MALRALDESRASAGRGAPPREKNDRVLETAQLAIVTPETAGDLSPTELYHPSMCGGALRT